MTILDSNVFIYGTQPAFAAAVRPYLVAAVQPAASVISRVEVLGFHKITAQEQAGLEALFALCVVLPVTTDVIDRSIALRQRRKMDLGDALIAGTALVHGLTLVTRNTADFAWVPGLTVIDPLAP